MSCMWCLFCLVCVFFFFKQKTAYEMRISDWSSDVCSSDLPDHALHLATEADEIFLLVLGDLIAPIALARFPDMARHREADAAIFAEHDRAVRLERRRDRKSTRLNSSH